MIICVVLMLIIILGNCTVYMVLLRNKGYRFDIYQLPLAIYITELLKERRLIKNEWNDNIRKINMTIDNNDDIYSVFNKCLSVALIIICLLLVVIMYTVNRSGDRFINDGYTITRPDYGKLKKRVKIDINGNGTHESAEFDIEPYKLNDKEINNLLDDVKEYIDNNICLDNKSLEEVNSNLNLIDSYPYDSEVTISWIVDGEGVIDYDGVVNRQKEDKIVELVLQLDYMDISREYSYKVKVLKKDEKSDVIADIKKSVEEANNETDTKIINLPKKVNGETITYTESKDNSSTFLLIILASVCIIAIFYSYKKDIDNKINMRNEEMIMDYGEVIHKFQIMLNAGMNITKAFEKICSDYKKNIRSNMAKRRYVYEEMCFTYSEILSNKSSQEAFREFGRRIGLVPYIRFSTILIQSLKLGNDKLISQIELEALEIVKERKEYIKQNAGRVSNYLLFPMVIMLGISIVIIILPALLTL